MKTIKILLEFDEPDVSHVDIGDILHKMKSPPAAPPAPPKPPTPPKKGGGDDEGGDDEGQHEFWRQTFKKGFDKWRAREKEPGDHYRNILSAHEKNAARGINSAIYNLHNSSKDSAGHKQAKDSIAAHFGQMYEELHGKPTADVFVNGKLEKGAPVAPSASPVFSDHWFKDAEGYHMAPGTIHHLEEHHVGSYGHERYAAEDAEQRASARQSIHGDHYNPALHHTRDVVMTLGFATGGNRSLKTYPSVLRSPPSRGSDTGLGKILLRKGSKLKYLGHHHIDKEGNVMTPEETQTPEGQQRFSHTRRMWVNYGVRD